SLFRDWSANDRNPVFFVDYFRVESPGFSYTPRPRRSVRTSTSFPVGFCIAAKLLPEARSTQAIRCLSINAATTLLSRTTVTFSSSEQIIFRRFARIQSPDPLFTLSD